ncbi:MAG: hypothetical protein OEL89_05240, partial [Candidatus Peregrinibacteria bacterium]|nr:hypothetical protein [Candidatus Peregrinibacteria bacterium]
MNDSFYYEIYIRGLHGVFTWHFEEELSEGARVRVAFRGRKKIGIVISKSLQKPDFKTQGILEVLDKEFISEKYVMLAKEVARDTFCDVGRVLSLMV